MRKMMCTVLILVLISGSFAAFSEGTSDVFDASIANSMGFSARDWFESEESRAVLTMILYSDLSSQISDSIDLSSFFTSATYVGKNQTVLVILGRIDRTLVTIMYSPIDGMAQYIIGTIASADDSILESIAEQACPDGYYKNDVELLKQCRDYILDVLSGAL